ncbi:MAG TPA: efflux RND transporter permease subunit, partial [Gemmatimonadales bacterium]
MSAAGVWVALRLPSAIYPELNFTRITVIAQGSPLGARQIVFSIVRPLEEAISLVPGVTRVHSHAIRGAAEINVTFTPRANMVEALQLVRARVAQVQSELPAGIDLEVERLAPVLFPIVSYNLEGGDPAALYDLARYNIRPLFSRVPGVGRVEVEGADVREIEVVADPARLAAQGLTYGQLADAISHATTVQAVGRLAQDYRSYLIVTDQEAKSADDIGAVVVGKGLRVRDIAVVQPGTEDRTRMTVGDGRPAVFINVARQLGGNTVEIADSVAHIAATLAATLPPGVHLKPVYDQAVLVRDAVRAVRDAMLVGAILAILVLFFFLRHIRITLISATSIPLTLIITVFVMGMLGASFNLMTLGAMAIAIGLVIDDAVVVTENIARHVALAAGQPGKVAVREAVQELIWPVTTSTITTVVVFLPLGLLQGVVGQFFAALAMTLTIAVLVSLLLALSVIPLLAERFVTAHQVAAAPASGVLGHVEQLVDGLPPRYERLLGEVLHRPRRVVAGVVVLVLAGVVCWQLVGTGFLPEMDEGTFVLDYFTPGGTALDETNRQLGIAEHILAQTPEVWGTSRRTGAELGFFATAQNSGDILVRLVPQRARDRDIFAVMDDLRDRIQTAAPRLHIEFMQILSDVINDLAGAARPVEVKLFGEQLDSVEAYARAIGPDLAKIDGIEDLYDGVSEPAAELLMHVNQAEVDRLGLTPSDVGDAVSAALLGVHAGEVR